MRIISGKYKGRIIQMPKGIRPTQDKVRKALFDILGDMEGLLFLELFAGTGAVGIEAVSQGASRVVFVENEPKCVEKIKEGISVLGFSGFRVLGLDAMAAIKQLHRREEKFDIIFMDPPYYRDLVLRLRSAPMVSVPRLRSGLVLSSSKDAVESLAKKILLNLSAYDILAPNGFVIAQHFKKDILPDTAGNLVKFKQARYGDTLLTFYKKTK